MEFEIREIRSPQGRKKKPRPPASRASVAEASSRSRYSSQEERLTIADLVREGGSIRSIAAALGRSPSTISREVRGNGHPTSGDYRPYAAQARADARRPGVPVAAGHPHPPPARGGRRTRGPTSRGGT
ncbi:helix-turn-helix domain-containing protein, partial [Nonomuraea sp. NPDC000554]|uniref:helix-turn-helix domain-containing protein n=1 Tax=Nonomuraea sp. NPDC000554 TaxID=3154259 RepID=UPI003324C18F